jgi:HTH-type transcriptional regulator / antitoxin HipB
MLNLIRSPKSLGNAIHRARKEQRLSQTQLGEKTGMQQSDISKIENGHAAMKLETLLSLLAALDLDLQITPRAKSSIKDLADML